MRADALHEYFLQSEDCQHHCLLGKLTRLLQYTHETANIHIKQLNTVLYKDEQEIHDS